MSRDDMEEAIAKGNPVREGYGVWTVAGAPLSEEVQRTLEEAYLLGWNHRDEEPSESVDFRRELLAYSDNLCR